MRVLCIEEGNIIHPLTVFGYCGSEQLLFSMCRYVLSPYGAVVFRRKGKSVQCSTVQSKTVKFMLFL